MRRNRKDNTKKERIIMIASSAFVLTALTLTGVYMQTQERKTQDGGYTIDFTALENNVEDKGKEIMDNTDDDLDYLPMEAGSSLVELPGLTDGEDAENTGKDAKASDQQTNADVTDTDEISAEEPQQTDAQQDAEQEALGDDVVVTQELRYSEGNGLLRPLAGNTLIPFSTEKSVYFSTLDQYKRNAAMMISAEEGTAVVACAEGKVINIFENEEIGHAITMELGDGYQITYGQLRDIRVAIGSYVNPGDTIATVAAPTKYYVREGSNLYLKLTANGTPVNPEPLFR